MGGYFAISSHVGAGVGLQWATFEEKSCEVALKIPVDSWLRNLDCRGCIYLVPHNTAHHMQFPAVLPLPSKPRYIRPHTFVIYPGPLWPHCETLHILYLSVQIFMSWLNDLGIHPTQCIWFWTTVVVLTTGVIWGKGVVKTYVDCYCKSRILLLKAMNHTCFGARDTELVKLGWIDTLSIYIYRVACFTIILFGGVIKRLPRILWYAQTLYWWPRVCSNHVNWGWNPQSLRFSEGKYWTCLTCISHFCPSSWLIINLTFLTNMEKFEGKKY